ncbi:MAG: ATP synthase F0 subunit C [Verrucomicrobiales bacterium]
MLHMLLPLAETSINISGNLGLAIAGSAAAIGVAMVGSKAVEAVGRNPSASGQVLTLAIIGMALAEAIAIYALVLALLQG